MKQLNNKIKRLERKWVYKGEDSLMIVNERLAMGRDSTTFVLNEIFKIVDSVNTSNAEMFKSLEKGALIGITNYKSPAVIIRSSGRIVETLRSRRADKLRVCFTIAQNTLA